MKNRNVLIVDDDPDIINLFNLVGKKLGLNIITATNGIDAFKAFSLNDFMMAITDLKMPKMDGVELMEKIRLVPKYRNFPFIIISANLKEFDTRVAFLEKVDIKEKPLTKDDIEELFQTKLQMYDHEAKTIAEESLIETLEKSLQSPCELLLEIVTKDKPEIVEEKIKAETTYLEGDYFLTYPTFIGGNKVSFVFLFTLPLARAIKQGVMPSIEEDNSRVENQNLITSLQKAIHPLLLKVFESSGFTDDFSFNRLPTIMGSNKSSSVYTFSIGKLVTSVKLRNKYGTLSAYIVIE